MSLRGRSLAGAARAALALLVVAFTLMLAATAAHAHAVVTSSDPADGERLAASPTSVTIEFSEGVSADLGGLKVLDAKGQRVDKDDSSQPTPTSLRVGLQDDLGDGTYVANYKVVSADGHPVSGAIVFGVGNAQLSDVSRLAETGDPTFEVTSKIGQFVTYVAALLAAGLAFFITFLHDGGRERPRLVRIAKWSAVFAAAGAAVTILSQAALATGQGVGAAFRSGVIGPLLRQGLGWSTAALLVGLALCLVALDLRRSVTAQAFAFYGGLAVTSSFVLWGHATESPRAAIAIPADLVHVAMAAVWFGGLVGLALVLRTRGRAATGSVAAGDGASGPSATVAAADPGPAADTQANRAPPSVRIASPTTASVGHGLPSRPAGVDDPASERRWRDGAALVLLAEGGEVVLADERITRQHHRVQVERLGHPPGRRREERVGHRPVEHGVAILP
jgi:copper transport protein